LRNQIIALLIFASCVAGAVIAFHKMSQLRSEASWLLVRADAHATDYAASLEGSFADTQLVTFAQRRALLERAQRWQTVEILCILLAGAAAVCGYGIYVLRRARRDTAEEGMVRR
jgi:hypothetical protein